VSAHAQRMRSLSLADKEDAYCRESKGGACTGGVRGEVRAGRREAGGGRRPRPTQLAHREGRDTAEMGQGTAGCGAHVERAIHVRDFGGLPVIQRLIERRRALPRVEKRGHTAAHAVRGAGGGRREATAAHAACRKKPD
jgi:hypothetical protein